MYHGKCMQKQTGHGEAVRTFRCDTVPQRRFGRDLENVDHHLVRVGYGDNLLGTRVQYAHHAAVGRVLAQAALLGALRPKLRLTYDISAPPEPALADVGVPLAYLSTKTAGPHYATLRNPGRAAVTCSGNSIWSSARWDRSTGGPGRVIEVARDVEVAQVGVEQLVEVVDDVGREARVVKMLPVVHLPLALQDAARPRVMLAQGPHGVRILAVVEQRLVRLHLGVDVLLPGRLGRGLRLLTCRARRLALARVFRLLGRPPLAPRPLAVLVLRALARGADEPVFP